MLSWYTGTHVVMGKDGTWDHGREACTFEPRKVAGQSAPTPPTAPDPIVRDF